MKLQLLWAASLLGLAPLFLPGCSTPETQPATPEPSEQSDVGTLEIQANGEDFIRQGFLSKDGWLLSFDHVYVTLADINAYQTDPPFNPESDTTAPQATEMVTVSEVHTVDLAAGDESAEPILVSTVADVPPGYFNALSWQLVRANSGPATGSAILLQGNATRDGETVDFTIRLEQELHFVCGEYVGEERKGFVEAADLAVVEATFHFDHLFGDAETPLEDLLNTKALGFDPLAVLAQNGQLDIDMAALQEQLSDEDYNRLLQILPSLGHVGEGHCREDVLTTS
jgi:hypothetical protein